MEIAFLDLFDVTEYIIVFNSDENNCRLVCVCVCVCVCEREFRVK